MTHRGTADAPLADDDVRQSSMGEAAHWLRVYGDLVRYTSTRGLAIPRFHERLTYWRAVHRERADLRVVSDHPPVDNRSPSADLPSGYERE